MKGLSFSEPMVRAWMEGRKTVTRRLMKPQPERVEKSPLIGWYGVYGDDVIHLKPRYLPGETVYIKEVWIEGDVRENENGDWEVFVIYRATNDIRPDGISCEKFGSGLWKGCVGMKAEELSRHIERMEVFGDKWRSPRFMPEWAARSHALIVSVRPEKIRDITEGEAIMEGFMFAGHGDDWMRHDGFRATWEKLHPGTWDQNPFVWRIELEKLP